MSSGANYKPTNSSSVAADNTCRVSEKKAYKLRQKTIFARIFRKKLYIVTFVYIQRRSDEWPISELRLTAGEYSQSLKVHIYNERNRLKALLTSLRVYSVPIDSVGNEINTRLRYEANVGDAPVWWGVGYRSKYLKRHPRLYYAPISARRYDGRAVHIRRTCAGNMVLVQRDLASVEQTPKFRIMESWIVSGLMYYLGGIVAQMLQRPTTVYYEKFAEKAEEGAFDLFLLARKKSNGRSFFVIDETSADYAEICDTAGVVKKYSWKYYWVIYRATSFIGTEVPTHLSILRSNNHFLRRRFYSRPFVFLQHGIIYMKNLGQTSAFVRGREGEPDYIVASSNKERDIIERDLLIPPERVLVTGLGQFSKITYGSVTEGSPDIATVMLTWKNYDEDCKEFAESSYYKSLMETLAVFKQSSFSGELRVVAHPKVQEALSGTDLRDVLWSGSVSTALEGTKLLITDYSSVAYNVFYRGAGVIFYQPDLERYEEENGELIPTDKEYIGPRAVDVDAFQKVLTDVLFGGSIHLKKVRTRRHNRVYETINQFKDGKNIERIYRELEARRLI